MFGRARIFLCLLFFFFCLAVGMTGSGGAADRERSLLKALTPDEQDDLQAGRGMGLAKAAELNGSPGPAHVLDRAEALNLSEAQKAALTGIKHAMTTEASATGRQILEREQALEHLFASGVAQASTVTALAVESGVLRGRLRAIHLAAHLETKAILSPEQIKRYEVLRGAAASSAGSSVTEAPGHAGH
ncbi:MAG: hypothetical protein FD149_1888 [Rhodospirillaceae bacterium]|nr:MAG: hypothetical protein FD149_1888 [Rhodospirillaceae bacterium]